MAEREWKTECPEFYEYFGPKKDARAAFKANPQQEITEDHAELVRKAHSLLVLTGKDAYEYLQRQATETYMKTSEEIMP